METLNGDFNVIGQRSDLDVVNGKISFKADADTTEFDTEIGVKESEQLFSQIEVYENGETKPYLVPKFIVIANNLVCGPTSPTPPLTDYFTKAETLSLLEDKEDLRIRKLVPVFDATATPSVVLHTVTASTVGVPIALYLRIETLTGSITNNFVYDLGITGDLTKYINGGTAPAGFDAVNEILPIDLSGFDSVPALSDLILTITTGSDATTMTVKALTDITEY